MKKKKGLLLSILGIISLVVITVGVSYAFFSYSQLGTKENTITTSTITFLYTEIDQVGAGIEIEDALPMSDEVGKAQTGAGKVFNFKVESDISGQASIPYEVTARKKNDSTLQEEAVKIYLTEVNGDSESELLLSNYSNLEGTNIEIPSGTVEKTIYTDTVAANSSYEKNFRLRMWIDENIDYSSGQYNGKTFTITINVYANAEVVTLQNSYKEALLNGADPVLNTNLVPVTIADDGTVTKADTSTEWYNYGNREWANAVVLSTATTYEAGSVIPENNIESYFVWIPRYRYQLWDLGTYTEVSTQQTKNQTINIIFEDKNTTPSTGSTINSYLTHPAFQTFDTNGIWVGKFESGYNGATDAATAQVSSTSSDSLIIKPNTYSWRSNTLGNMFKVSYDYLRTANSHMIKNTEWGAVAYLSHSAYGINNEITKNNNSTYLTGCGGTVINTSSSAECTNRYGDVTSYPQSTTGNISGIFDLNGGAWEYAMGYATTATTVGGSSAITTQYSDFFTSNTWDKYYDKYEATSYTVYTSRILGDSTGEIGPFNMGLSSWYNDYGNFIYQSRPWFMRGGNYSLGTASGTFGFNYSDGAADNSRGFRTVLAI